MVEQEVQQAFDEIRKLFRETDERFAKERQEREVQFDKERQERIEGFKELRELFKETDRQFKETDQKIKELADLGSFYKLGGVDFDPLAPTSGPAD